MNFEQRCSRWEESKRTEFDVAIVGGGINGVCLYHHPCEQGYSVLLIEKGNFAGGTSQASAMMIGGGLLYLRNWDFLTVQPLTLQRVLGAWFGAGAKHTEEISRPPEKG